MNGNKSLLTRVVLGALASLAVSFSAFGQISFGGVPASFHNEEGAFRATELSSNVIRVTPNFNAEDLRAQESWNMQQTHIKPLTVGRVIERNIDFAKEAQCVTLENGQKVYRLTIELPGANGTMITYKDFFIPKNAGRLFIYTPDHKQILGAYTHDTHKEHGVFSTEPLYGSTAIMEWVPNVGDKLPNILISGVAYIYNKNVLKKDLINVDPGEDASLEDCQVNVNCKEGAKWQAEKTGVCQMFMLYPGGGVSVCSGNLLNNTAQDWKPYILSAAHCVGISKEFNFDPELMKQWVFSFHYEKPNCSNGQRALPRRKTMIGCQMRSYLSIDGESDGLLLELLNEIPKEFRVYYNGWDRSGKNISKGVGIHHPAGDAKKIAVLNKLTEDAMWHGEKMGFPNAHFFFDYEIGKTEGGSSGSSLFNQDHRVVGTLSGGGDFANSPCKSYEYYGKLQYHWDKFKKAGVPSSQMASFLDPKKTGQITLDGAWRDNLRPLESVKDVRIVCENETVKVTWTPVNTTDLPKKWKVKYRIYRNGRYLDDQDVTEGSTFEEPKEVALGKLGGNLIYGVQARYLYNGDVITETTFGDSDIIEEGIYAGSRVEKMQVASTKNNIGSKKGRYISWQLPKNLQEISLFGYPSKMELEPFRIMYIPAGLFGAGFPKTAPYAAVITSKFPSYFFQNFSENSNNQYIYAVKLIPTPSVLEDYENDKNDYRLYMRCGTHKAGKFKTQRFTIPKDWKPGEWITVKLNKPYKVDPQKSLYVGYKARNVAGRQSHGVMQVLNTKDDNLVSVDGLVSFDSGKTFLDRLRWRAPANGYLAIRLLVTSDKDPNESNTEEVFSKGKQPVPFPEVVGYKVYRDGVVVSGDTPLTFREYIDEAGTETSKYEVEVIYKKGSYILENQEISNKIERPYVFPSHIGIDGTLNISGNNNVHTLYVYNMEGKLVLQEKNPANTISLENLPSGNYIVVLETAQGRISEQIIR